MGKIQPFKEIGKIVNAPVKAFGNVLKGKINLGDIATLASLIAPGGDITAFIKDPNSFGAALKNIRPETLGTNFLGSHGINVDSLNKLNTADLMKLAQSAQNHIPGGDLAAHIQSILAANGSGTASNSGYSSQGTKPTKQQLALRQQAFDALDPRNFDTLARQFRSKALAAADVNAKLQGAMITQMTGNPALAAAIRLSQMNKATTDANANRAALFSPSSISNARLKQAQLFAQDQSTAGLGFAGNYPSPAPPPKEKGLFGMSDSQLNTIIDLYTKLTQK